MINDIEARVRTELGAATPPESAHPDLARVLAEGDRALRRRTVVRSIATGATVVLVAVGGVYGWSQARTAAGYVPAASPTVTSTPTSAEWRVTYGAVTDGASSPNSVVTVRYDTADDTLRAYHAPAGSASGPGTLVASFPAHAIATPEVHRTSLSTLSIVTAPVGTQWATILGADPSLVIVDPQPGAPVAVGIAVTRAAVPTGPTLIWRDGSGRLHSSTGDRADVVAIPGTDPDSVLFVFRKLGVVGVSDGGGANTASLETVKPGQDFAHGQNLAGPGERWFSTFLLPAGAHDVTVTPTHGVTLVGAVATADVPGGGVAATTTWTSTSVGGTPRPLTSITWVDAGGHTHTQTVHP